MVVLTSYRGCKEENDMTHISKSSTKKDFKDSVDHNADNVYLSDPSMFDPCSGYLPKILEKKGSITVTNHPKRSWFAAVDIHKGKIRVR